MGTNICALVSAIHNGSLYALKDVVRKTFINIKVLNMN